MTRPRAFRRSDRRQPLGEATRAWLLTGSAGAARSSLEDFLKQHHPHQMRQLWRARRDELLPDFIAEHPGRRPHAWWCFDAPEPARRRLGGTGRPAHECTAYVEVYDFGIPRHWVESWMVRYFSRDFRGIPIDRRDPPTYESEATYLKRHGLLSAVERAGLAGDAFEPETITEGGDDDDTRVERRYHLDRRVHEERRPCH